jgi:hypothetical protein
MTSGCHAVARHSADVRGRLADHVIFVAPIKKQFGCRAISRTSPKRRSADPRGGRERGATARQAQQLVTRALTHTRETSLSEQEGEGGEDRALLSSRVGSARFGSARPGSARLSGRA